MPFDIVHFLLLESIWYSNMHSNSSRVHCNRIVTQVFSFGLHQSLLLNRSKQGWCEYLQTQHQGSIKVQLSIKVPLSIKVDPMVDRRSLEKQSSCSQRHKNHAWWFCVQFQCSWSERNYQAFNFCSLCIWAWLFLVDPKLLPDQKTVLVLLHLLLSLCEMPDKNGNLQEAFWLDNWTTAAHLFLKLNQLLWQRDLIHGSVCEF